MQPKSWFRCNESQRSYEAEVEFNLLKSDTSLGSHCRNDAVEV